MTTILRLPGEPAELTLPALLLRNAEDHGDLLYAVLAYGRRLDHPQLGRGAP